MVSLGPHASRASTCVSCLSEIRITHPLPQVVLTRTSLRRPIAFLVVVGVRRAEPILILERRDKCTDHASIITRVLCQSIQPEVVATRIRFPAQIAEVLR